MRSEIVQLGELIHNAMLEFAQGPKGGCGISPVDLGGGCAVGSYFLTRELRRCFGIRSSFVATSAHCFVEYDRHIYDITATQFGRKEKVYVIKKPINVERYTLDTITGSTWLGHAYSTNDRYGIQRVNREWPSYQRPNNYRFSWFSPTKARIRYVGP